MQNSFDLLSEPWVPCISTDGTVAHKSVKECLRQAHRSSGIHADSPLEAVALLRMLLAILYRAYSPRTLTDWRALWNAKELPPEPLESYLREWADRWDLFGDRPWMQTAGLTTDKADSLNRLATEAASGNNPTLFDHRSDGQPEAYSPASAARMLLAAQSFALGFGKAADAIIDGSRVARPYSADAILLRGVTVYLTGDTLRETLLLNLVPYDALSVPDPEQDVPCWELEDGGLSLADGVRGKERITEGARGPADRNAWGSRLIRLIPETDSETEQVVVRRVYFTQGRSADKSPGDPMKPYRSLREQGNVVVSLSAGKAAWRDAHALLTIGDDSAPADVITFAARLVRRVGLPSGAQWRLNVIGLATDPGKAGKFLLWRHDRMTLPPVLLADPNRRDQLARCLTDADESLAANKGEPNGVARELNERTRRLCRLYLAPDSDERTARQPDPKDVDRLADDIDPRRNYWARLEHHFVQLVAGLGGDRPDKAEIEWRDAVEREARRSLLGACAALGYTASPDSRSAGRVIFAMARVPGHFTCGKRGDRTSNSRLTLADEAIRSTTGEDRNGNVKGADVESGGSKSE